MVYLSVMILFNQLSLVSDQQRARGGFVFDYLKVHNVEEGEVSNF
jgi:hypothetical protein